MPRGSEKICAFWLAGDAIGMTYIHVYSATDIMGTYNVHRTMTILDKDKDKVDSNKVVVYKAPIKATVVL